jgi:hypothetical protein
MLPQFTFTASSNFGTDRRRPRSASLEEETKEQKMRALLTGTALAALTAFAIPAMAQSSNQNSVPENNPSMTNPEPGTGGTSKPGVEGLPGNKSGAATDSDSSSSSEGAASGQSGTANDAAGSDNSKVQGLPGNKSGPAQKPSDQ